MKIGIVCNSVTHAGFFINLALYLTEQGAQVVFLRPNKTVVIMINKYGLDYVNYRAKEAGIVLAELTCNKIIFWNGTFDSQETFFCSKNNIDAWFCENGYFANTFQLNKGGVNAQADFAQCTFEELQSFSYPEQNLLKIEFTPVIPCLSKKEYFVSKILGGRDQWGSMLRAWRVSRLEKNFKTLQPHLQNIKQEKPYVLFPLQVNDDTQITHNSSYDDVRQVLKLLLPELTKKYKIIVKEHPFETQKVDYSFVTNYPNTMLVQKENLDEVIAHCDFVIVVNSSVGLQALEKNKKVMLLGDAFYAHAPGVISCNVLEDNITEKISEVKMLTVDHDLQREYVRHIRTKIFIEGDWKDPTSDFLHRICERILA